MKISDQDRRLLREIQRDCSLSLGELADRCNMAQSTVWRKLQEFETVGIIQARRAVLNPAKVGANLCIFANVSLNDHSEEAISAFAMVVRTHNEILECHALTGTSDYVLKIRVADVESYEAFMTHYLLRNPHVHAVVSSFSLKQLKSTTELPF